MTEQPQGGGPALTPRQTRDLLGLLCLLAALVILNVVGWTHSTGAGLLTVAADLAVGGYLLGSDR